jgi:hypothetical protein
VPSGSLLVVGVEWIHDIVQRAWIDWRWK